MNKFSKQRKLVSPNKFQRIFNNNLDCTGTAMIYRDHNTSWENSLSAVKVGSFVYCQFACKRQKGSRLETFYIKYNVEDNPLDNIVFVNYPRHVQPKVEF